MIYFLYTIFFISCIMLIVSVLLQPGKTDAGALFTSNISSSAFGPRGTATVLSKITIVAATVFMLSALFISMPALQGGVSVLSGNPEGEIESTQPPITNLNSNTADANTAPPANAAVTANTTVTANSGTTVVIPANGTNANTAPANTTNGAANANK